MWNTCINEVKCLNEFKVQMIIIIIIIIYINDNNTVTFVCLTGNCLQNVAMTEIPLTTSSVHVQLWRTKNAIFYFLKTINNILSTFSLHFTFLVYSSGLLNQNHATPVSHFSALWPFLQVVIFRSSWVCMFHVKLASHIVDFNQANYNNNALGDRNGYTVMKKSEYGFMYQTDWTNRWN